MTQVTSTAACCQRVDQRHRPGTAGGFRLEAVPAWPTWWAGFSVSTRPFAATAA